MNLEHGKLNLTCEDNMELMARYPDNYFELAIVDPPYGIDICKMNLGFSKSSKFKKKDWDACIPSEEYFEELFRLSKNQIIWGANYFHLPLSRSFIVWDKGPSFYNRSFSEAEQAWTSFNINAKIIKLCPIKHNSKKIHKTQKPVKLYEWLLMNYAKEGDKILDTHFGSLSIGIACHNLGFELTACEIDQEYYDNGIKRVKQHISQQRLW